MNRSARGSNRPSGQDGRAVKRSRITLLNTLKDTARFWNFGYFDMKA